MLFIAVLVVCIVPNVALSVVERMTVPGRIANVLLPLGFMMCVLSMSRRTGVTALCLFPLMIFDAFQIVLLCIYGESVIGIDMLMNVETTNPSEAWELLSHIRWQLAGVAALYLLPMGTAVYAAIAGWKTGVVFTDRTRRISAVCMSAGIASLLFALFADNSYRPSRDMFPYNVCCNLYQAYVRSQNVAQYDKSCASFRFGAADAETDTISAQGRLMIIVIGETSRADNWSMFGYGRKTTESIDTVGGIFAFPCSMSESNTTHKSVPLLLTHLDASDFGREIYRVKGITAAFREAGWETWYISNQHRNHSLIDRIAGQSDHVVFIDGHSGLRAKDRELLPHLSSALSSPARKKLIVLHTYGSHFNYEDRYDIKDAMFPDATTEPSSYRNRSGLIDAYDNTVQYTARLLHDIIEMADASGSRAVVAYTSDHGEDIYDDSLHRFLHASPRPSYWQLHVPFFIWLSADYSAAHPEVADALEANSRKHVSTSASFFHTLVDIAYISTPCMREDRSLASPAYRPCRAVYLNDYNEAVDLRESGFKAEDFKRMGQMRREY